MKLSQCNILILFTFFALISSSTAQYDFDIVHQVDNTAVKSQGKTGTCWSFAATSFIESEIIRTKGEHLDLSEMFIVRDVYVDKARNYLLRQGKANFSEGALAHDMINAALRQGIVPEQVYSGKEGKKHDHSVMFDSLKGYLDTLIQQKKVDSNWEKGFVEIMDSHLNASAESFVLEEVNYTPKEYYSHYDLRLEDYINLSSFTHHPFNQEFILEIPDNYSNGSYLNVPIDSLESYTDKAIKNGHSVVWDGDVSEKGFSSRKGLAINPKEFTEDCFKDYCEELEVSQEDRQTAFENYVTTDDHLMHLVGIAKNDAGEKFYIIKNSWGEISDYKGYLMMSRSYFRAKTVGITLHKDLLDKEGSE